MLIAYVYFSALSLFLFPLYIIFCFIFFQVWVDPDTEYVSGLQCAWRVPCQPAAATTPPGAFVEVVGPPHVAAAAHAQSTLRLAAGEGVVRVAGRWARRCWRALASSLSLSISRICAGVAECSFAVSQKTWTFPRPRLAGGNRTGTV